MLGSVHDPITVLSELTRVATHGAVVANLEQDFRARLDSGTQHELRLLRKDDGTITLQVVRYLAQPYRIRDERYTLDTTSDFCQSLLAQTELSQMWSTVTDLSPEDMPLESIVDAFYEEETQFDPATLREVFEHTGFEMLDQRIVVSYNRPHIFSLFRRC
jgi:hypothetical protein